jgi:hypothetical protein
VLLKGLQEELVVPGVGVAVVLNVVEGSVDLRALELHPVLGKGEGEDFSCVNC